MKMLLGDDIDLSIGPFRGTMSAARQSNGAGRRSRTPVLLQTPVTTAAADVAASSAGIALESTARVRFGEVVR